MWDFFRDTNGRIHGTRIAGVIYVVALLAFGGLKTEGLTPMFLARSVFVLGWWLSFCDKQSPAGRTWLRDVRHLIGLILVVASITAEFALIPPR
jgi:hypothetical protein